MSRGSSARDAPGPRIVIERADGDDTPSVGGTSQSWAIVRGVALALALALALVLALAFASTLSAPSATSGSGSAEIVEPFDPENAEGLDGFERSTVDRRLPIVATVLLIGIAALLLWAILRWTGDKSKPPLRRALTNPLLLVWIVAVVASLLLMLSLSTSKGPSTTVLPTAAETEQVATAQEVVVAEEVEEPPEQATESFGDWGNIGLLVLVLAAAGLLMIGALNRRRSAATSASVNDGDGDLAERDHVVSELMAALRTEPDPRRAIQRAFAALETGFDRPEMRRSMNETSSAYLKRTLGANGNVAEPLKTLTSLFEVARYSETEIDEPMRSEAIAALDAIRASWSDRGNRLVASRGDRPAH